MILNHKYGNNTHHDIQFRLVLHVIEYVVGWENPDLTTKQVLQLRNPTPNVTSI